MGICLFGSSDRSVSLVEGWFSVGLSFRLGICSRLVLRWRCFVVFYGGVVSLVEVKEGIVVCVWFLWFEFWGFGFIFRFVRFLRLGRY